MCTLGEVGVETVCNGTLLVQMILKIEFQQIVHQVRRERKVYDGLLWHISWSNMVLERLVSCPIAVTDKVISRVRRVPGRVVLKIAANSRSLLTGPLLLLHHLAPLPSIRTLLSKKLSNEFG